MIPVLKPRCSGGGTVVETQTGFWRLEIPAGSEKAYRCAQLDDYTHLRRGDFHWKPGAGGLRLSLRARVSEGALPGTWGFGLWNDPFSVGLGVEGAALRLPALPNTAWFFYAGPGNYLAFQDTHPAEGLLAATFSSPRIPGLLLAPGALALPMLTIRPLARLLRRAASKMIGESGALAPVDPTEWHAYGLEWRAKQARFSIDGSEIFTTPVSPRSPLGLVLWIDNQYAAFPPSGRLGMGTSANPQAAWLEMEMIEIES